MTADLQKTTGARSKWTPIYRGVPLPTLIPELGARQVGSTWKFRCPACGENTAWLKIGGTHIHCNRKNKCDLDRPIGDYLWEDVLKARGWTKRQMAEHLEKLAADVPAEAGEVGPHIEPAYAVHADTEVYDAALALAPMTEEGLNWLGNERGIGPDVASQGDLGLISSPGAFCKSLAERFGLDRLTAAGIRSADGRFKFENHRLIFAYRVGGTTHYLTGRAIDPIGPNQRKEIHVGGPITCPWGLDAIPDGAHVHITEGGIDALTLRDIGYHAVSIPGASVWKETFGLLLLVKSVTTVTIALDPDPAGQGSVARIAGDLMRRGIFVYQLVLPMVRKKGIEEPEKADANDWFGKRGWKGKAGNPTRDDVAGWEGSRLHVCVGEGTSLPIKKRGLKAVEFPDFDHAEKGLLTGEKPPAMDIALVTGPAKHETEGRAERLAKLLLKKHCILRHLLSQG